MKTIFCLITLFVGNMYAAMANNEPQKIYSLSRQNLAVSYYQQQAKLWKAVIDHQPQQSEAWLNYFKAHHLLYQKQALTLSELKMVGEALQKALPDSYEANWADYACSNSYESLLKAYQLRPEGTETYAALMAYYEKNRDRQKMQQLSGQWLASGEYSEGMLQWNYNVLIGLEDNAILLTEGDNNTHPIWLLQYGKNIRPDVRVLNLDLLTNSHYRQLVFEQLNLAALLSNDKADIVQHLMQHIQKAALYMGISIPKGLVKEQEDRLYIVGLAFRYEQQNFDNISELINNYEHKYLTDYLKVNLTYDISQELVNQQNVNYLPGFLILHSYYRDKKDYAAANAIKKLCTKIAARANKSTTLEAYFNNNIYQNNDKPLVKIGHRTIESAFAKLPYHTNLYAGLTEVSNHDYELFLSDLLQRKQFDALAACKIYKNDWRSWLPEAYKGLGDEAIFENGNPSDPQAPIQNISYESAKAYCDWLTAVYNNIEHRKKKFKRVRFRLPTEAEWIAAATAQSPNKRAEEDSTADAMEFPWSTSTYSDHGSGRNQKGCFLANFNVSNEAPCEDCPEHEKAAKDGAFFPVHVDTYFPNSLGLYNTIGNVAEMLSEKGKAKGGSWYHAVNNSTISEVQSYNQAQPYLGFRVFMEVIEDASAESKRQGTAGPPGTYHLQGNLYMDRTEIDNISWLEYQSWLKRHQPEAFAKSVLDTMVWTEVLSYNEPFVKAYATHPAYHNYPVVGITHQQAVDYCAWRSKVVNEMLALNPNQLKRYGKVLYRLPSNEEWELAASGGLNTNQYPHGFELSDEEALEKAINLQWWKEGDLPSERASFPAPTFSYRPNNKGFHNLIGNLAEMIDVEGVAKGGSWMHNKATSKISDRLPYSKPTAWLGFRCICEIKH